MRSLMEIAVQLRILSLKYESYQWQLLQDTWWQLGGDRNQDKKELMHIPQSWDKWLQMNWVW